MKIKQVFANVKEKEIEKDGKKYKVNDRYVTVYTDHPEHSKVYLNYIDLLKAVNVKIEYKESKKDEKK